MVRRFRYDAPRNGLGHIRLGDRRGVQASAIRSQQAVPVMGGDVTTQELAATIIAMSEGLRLKAYRDSGGVLTIGLGHTRDVTDSMTITADQAASLFAQDSAHLFQMTASLPVLEAAALVSFGYNCGVAALQRVLDGQDTIASPRHTTDRAGNVLPGLVNRRRLEEMLCALSQQLSPRK